MRQFFYVAQGFSPAKRFLKGVKLGFSPAPPLPEYQFIHYFFKNLYT